jgi:vacuolar-type H+-ATPase subunit C/Vma6
VTGAAQFAFGNTRVRAMKSRLLRPEDAAALRTAAKRGAFFALMQDIVGIEAENAAEVHIALFGRLVADYEKILRSYRTGTELFLALLRLHEVENLKLAWRALAHALPAERWLSCWRPLGRLEVLKLEDWREAGSLRHAITMLRRTPYEHIGAIIFRAHEADPTAAELAIDRWASTRLLEAARALPPAERSAADLVFRLVRERDFDILFRGVWSYGLAPDLAISTAVLLPAEVRRADLQLLAKWTPEWGPLAPLLPPRLLRDTSGITDPNALRRALRAARRHSCRRAFMEPPFQLAPAVAFLLLREEEVRGLTALAEAQGNAALDDLLTQVLAGSMMGS